MVWSVLKIIVELSGPWTCVLVLFFFQAEDGIRDIGVTGVQTCALPICTSAGAALRRGRAADVPARRSDDQLDPDPPPAPRDAGRGRQRTRAKRRRAAGLARGRGRVRGPRRLHAPRRGSPAR